MVIVWFFKTLLIKEPIVLISPIKSQVFVVSFDLRFFNSISDKKKSLIIKKFYISICRLRMYTEKTNKRAETARETSRDVKKSLPFTLK